MIFTRDSIFPYPVLTNNNTTYKNNVFELEIEELFDTEKEYTFKINYHLGSSYIQDILQKGYAELVFVINSQDSYFQTIKYDQDRVTVPKNSLSLSNRTKIQLQIRVLKSLYFAKNNDLQSFYDQYKKDLIVKRNSILGFSNIVEYKGSETKPYDLFETAINSEQEEIFKVELRENIIVLSFKDRNYLLNSYGAELKNLYLYTGLSRALTMFVINNGNGDEIVYLEELNDTSSTLDSKLLDLMNDKGIVELSFSNIDNVIAKTSYKIIDRFVDSIERLSQSEY